MLLNVHFTCNRGIHLARHLSKLYQTTIVRNLNSNSGAYDGPGKTTVDVLQKSNPEVNLINTYSAAGFRLSNEVFVRGSILVFPTHVFSWRVRRGADITPESLLIFDLIVPKIKILVIGYGSRGEPYDVTITNHLRRKGISCEILPTPNAVTTYNYLVADAVPVAGAFIPMSSDVSPTTKDFQAIAGDKGIYEKHNYEHIPYNVFDELDRYGHTRSKKKEKLED